MTSEDEAGDESVDGDGVLSSLIPLRTDVVRGDRRMLYLAWLLCAQCGDLADGDIEPEVPAGLGELSPSLESLVEFLRIDPDLLHVAAQASPPREALPVHREKVLAWVRSATSCGWRRPMRRIVGASRPRRLQQRRNGLEAAAPRRKDLDGWTRAGPELWIEFERLMGRRELTPNPAPP